MLLCNVKKSAKTALNTWNRQQNWQKVNYHFGDRPVFGYQKDTRNLENLRITIDTFTEKQLIDEFRNVGHFLANINPLESRSQLDDQLQKWPEQTSLLKGYLDNKTKLNDNSKDVNELISYLTSIYCNQIGIEFMHITNVNEREWIASYWEELSKQFKLDVNLKQRIAELMIKCETFDEYLALKFPSLKRYGAEGLCLINLELEFN